MASFIESRYPVEKVSEIVSNTRVLVDRLRLAILHQDNLTKDCFDTNATELSKTVDSIKASYVQLGEELQEVKEEIKSGEWRLNELLEEYKTLLQENESLKDVENGFLNQKTLTGEHEKISRELKEMLQVYKLLTGVRFDFSDTPDTLTGYVGISGCKPSNSTLIPFDINISDNANTKKLLWEKINEACLEIAD